MNITRITKHTVACVLAAAILIPCLAFANPAAKASGAPAGLSQGATATAGGADKTSGRASCETDAHCWSRERCVKGACVAKSKAAVVAQQLEGVDLTPRGFQRGDFGWTALAALPGSFITAAGVLVTLVDCVGLNGPCPAPSIQGLKYAAAVGAGSVGGAAGAYFYGRAQGFNGSFTAALIGHLTGTVLALGTTRLVTAATPSPDAGALFAVYTSSMLILPSIGAALGYKLSINSDKGPQRTSGALLDHTPGMGLGFSAPAVSPIMGKQGLIGGHVKLLGGQF